MSKQIETWDELYLPQHPLLRNISRPHSAQSVKYYVIMDGVADTAGLKLRFGYSYSYNGHQQHDQKIV